MRGLAFTWTVTRDMSVTSAAGQGLPDEQS